MFVEINEKINKIRSIRGNNALLNKIKKQMELRKNFEEICKEVEKKTFEYEKKNMENKNVNTLSADRVQVSKGFYSKGNSPMEKLRVTGANYFSEEKTQKENKVLENNIQNQNNKRRLPKILSKK